MKWIKGNLKWIGLFIGAAVVALVVLSFVFKLNDRDKTIAELATELATSEKTVEISKNLYAIKTREVKDLVSALEALKGKSGEEIARLKDQLKRAEQEILTLNSVVVRWKKAYEAAVEASQTEEPGEGETVRKRVTFTKDFGYIGVSGWTLTDPPEGYVKVEQLRPLRLTLAVTKNRNGTWSSLVTSSEDNLAVDIDVSGVDLSVISPKWYQRLWMGVEADALGDLGAGVSLTYVSDKWSLGAACRAGQSNSCGLTAGFRLFR